MKFLFSQTLGRRLFNPVPIFFYLRFFPVDSVANQITGVGEIDLGKVDEGHVRGSEKHIEIKLLDIT